MKTVKRAVLMALALSAAFSCTACGSTGSNSRPNPSDSGNSANQQGSEASKGDDTMGTPYVIDDYYIFELNENVERTAVFCTNRYGITLAGDLYVSKDLDQS